MDFSQAAEEDVTLQVQVQKVQESRHRLEPHRTTIHLIHHFKYTICHSEVFGFPGTHVKNLACFCPRLLEQSLKQDLRSSRLLF